jgi:flavin reductase (DIM6/NTAB) family NADH-FMN oxidoreductase RutF
MTHLAPMNATSVDAPPGFDEFEHAGLERAEARRVDAPFVASAPAILECRSEREVDLGAVPNTLIIGRVLCVRLRRTLPRVEGTDYVEPTALRPVGRLYGAAYLVGGEVRIVPRPTVHDEKETTK